MLKPNRSRLAALLAGSLLCGAVAARAGDISNEYRLTAYPSYKITDKIRGIGYLGWVSKPDGNYNAYYGATGAYSQPKPWLQYWLGVITVYTDFNDESDDLASTLELRPFAGVKFMGANQNTNWRYYNWTRYELRETQNRDNGDWSTVHRLRNQVRIEIPLAAKERVWTPKSWYLLADVEPIYRSDSGQIDPLRLRAGLGYIANPRLLVEFQYYNQFTRPGGGSLEYTDNIIRLNFKILTKDGLLSGLGGDLD